MGADYTNRPSKKKKNRTVGGFLSAVFYTASQSRFPIAATP